MTLFWRKLHSVNHGSSRLSPDHLLDEGRRGEAKGPYFTYDPFINAMFFSVHKYACLKLVCSAWRKKFKIIKKHFDVFVIFCCTVSIAVSKENCQRIWISSNGEITFTKENMIKANVLFIFTIKQKFSRVSCEGRVNYYYYLLCLII